MASPKEGIIWLDGNYLPWEQAAVHVLTHSLHYGLGIFEGIRAYASSQGTALFRANDHIQRFFASAHILNIPIPFTPTELNTACVEVVRKNNLPAAYIRPLAFYGNESIGMDLHNLSAHVMIAAWKWDALLGDNFLQKGLKVKTSSFNRLAPNSALLKAKVTGHYFNSILAVQEAKRYGCDEALFLDQTGFVCEGSGENIFIVRNRILYTPDTSSALEGITRDTIMTVARDLGYEVREKRLTRDEVYIADEAFFTGTAAEVLPICELDGRKIGQGIRGPITEQLQSAFFAIVRDENARYADWLMRV
jgi:branched-chain amino acid aminotransferase